KNVEFRRNSGADLPVFDCTISSVFSCHVFQHFDSLEVARQYLLEAHRVLCEGGTLMIHVPIYRWPNQSRAYRWLHQWQTGVLVVPRGGARRVYTKRLLRSTGAASVVPSFRFEQFPAWPLARPSGNHSNPSPVSLMPAHLSSRRACQQRRCLPQRGCWCT